MIVKTEAVVLSAMKYRETSKIARLYTREFGKISVIAKGARTSRSKFRGALEPGQHVLAVLYKKENRELHLLSQCDVLSALRHTCEDIGKMQVALSAIELLNVVTHGEERNEELFDLLLSYLHAVDDATKTPWAALYYFELRLSGLLGFQPELDVCSRCGSRIEERAAEGRYGFGHGGILCRQCGEGALVSLSPACVHALRALRRFSSPGGAMNLVLSGTAHEEIRRAMRAHFQSHIEGFRGLKSEEVFAAL